MIDHSGIGTYIKNLIPLIIEAMPDSNFYLLYNKKNILNDKFNLPNVELILFKSNIYTISEQFEYYKIAKINLDYFWSPHYNIPIFIYMKLIVTIHDIFHLKDKKLTFIKKIYAQFMFFIIKNKASKIITDSNFTKSEMINHLNIKSSSIQVVHLGVNPYFKKINKRIKDKFLLYVGNIKKHKNLNFLLKAFDLIDNKNLKLYIVGDYQELRTPDYEVLNSINNNDNIILKGRINNELLREYYSNAEIFIFPSKYEGFGLPPLEAMACGCPVLASNKAAIPEICSSAAQYFDPYNIDDLVGKINNLMNDKILRDELISQGYKNILNYSWNNSSDKIINLIENMNK